MTSDEVVLPIQVVDDDSQAAVKQCEEALGELACQVTDRDNRRNSAETNYVTPSFQRPITRPSWQAAAKQISMGGDNSQLWENHHLLQPLNLHHRHANKPRLVFQMQNYEHWGKHAHTPFTSSTSQFKRHALTLRHLTDLVLAAPTALRSNKREWPLRLRKRVITTSNYEGM